MATLKLKHLVLFIISFFSSIFSDLPGGALFLLFVWMQMALLLWGKKFTWKNQIKFAVIFLFLLPTIFLWGAVNSFISIYTKESHLVFIAMYGLLSFVLCFWITLFSVFSFAYSKEEEPILYLFIQIVSQIKSHRFVMLYVSLIVFLIAVAPLPLAEDYRIVLGIVLAHCFLKYEKLKTAIKETIH